MKNDSGVAMLEMTFIGILFIFIVGFMLDILVLFFRTQVLVSAVNQVTRDISINHFQTEGALNAWAPRQLRNVINDNYVTLDDVTGDSDINVEVSRGDRQGAACLYEISAEWSDFCVFCLFPMPPARARAQAFIEDECFNCL